MITITFFKLFTYMFLVFLIGFTLGAEYWWMFLKGKIDMDGHH